MQCKPQNRRESKAGVDGTRARGWETPPPPAPSTWGPVRAGLPWGSDTPSGVGRGALAFLLSVLAVSDLLSYRLFEKSFLRGFLLWYNTHDETGGPRRLCVRRHCALTLPCSVRPPVTGRLHEHSVRRLIHVADGRTPVLFKAE